jgi:hypothetical protein
MPTAPSVMIQHNSRLLGWAVGSGEDSMESVRQDCSSQVNIADDGGHNSMIPQARQLVA